MKDTKNCPKCGALVVLFADYNKNDLFALGLRCARRCGWRLTMGDVLAENEKLRKLVKAAYREAQDNTIGLLGERSSAYYTANLDEDWDDSEARKALEKP